MYGQETEKTDNIAYSVKQTEYGADVLRNNKLVYGYLSFSGAKPVLYPVIGPDEVEMTRRFPLKDALPTEKSDHVHHRSLWFTHGEVNGTDFWAEGPNHGEIRQRVINLSDSGDTATIASENDWVTSNGKRLLSDERQFVFSDYQDMQCIDVSIKLISHEEPVTFGDTKEGSFGVRVAGTMKVDAGKGGKIVTSKGLEDGDAWGKQAEWVDYYGPVNDSVVGIAILNHPSSFGFPTRWHVRTYGLFAANPFGVHHFTGGKPTEGVELLPNSTILLKYRVLLHRGTTAEARISEAWEDYVNTK